MSDNILVKILLAPISLIYGVAVGARNLLYRKGILRSVSFDIPVIGVGNLSAGGTGKSPHTEYILRYLKAYMPVGTLSRGYKRRTEGTQFVDRTHQVEDVGDEPLQIKLKNPDTVVVVSEKRVLAIPEMLAKHPQLKCILLDDSYQHLAVTPGLNLLLTTYDRPFYGDHLLPSGKLREWRDGYRRADIIIVTKCPENLSESEMDRMSQEIEPFPNQKLYFTKYRYGKPYYLFSSKYRLEWEPGLDTILICGIANPKYMEDYLIENVARLHTMPFPDHYYFQERDILDLVDRFKNIEGNKKAVITTEKDAVRLFRFKEIFFKHNIPLFVLPIQVEFLDQAEERFQNDLKQFMLNFTV